MGGFVGDVLGSVTGGLIGESPEEKRRKELKKAEERQRQAQKEADERKRKEELLAKQQEEDLNTVAQKQQEEAIKTTKPQTTVDFTQSIKKEEDDEDKLLKALRVR